MRFKTISRDMELELDWVGDSRNKKVVEDHCFPACPTLWVISQPQQQWQDPGKAAARAHCWRLPGKVKCLSSLS